MSAPQGSDAWLASRRGRVTASRMADVMAVTAKGEPSAKRAAYQRELLQERLTGLTVEHHVNAAMQWGTDHEPQARARYEIETGADVVVPGFIVHPGIPMAGASPDGLIGADGGVEFKCPTTGTHIDTLKAGAVPDERVWQVQWCMACTGRRWWDWVSFDPRMPAPMQMLILRVDRDEALIARMEGEARSLIAAVEADAESLWARYGRANAFGEGAFTAADFLRAG